MRLTREQMNIVERAVEKYKSGGGYVLVNAFAGTGKTSTMIEVVKALRDNGAERILYLAFNKKMADEAKKKLDGLAEARTMHSLAYAAVAQAVGYDVLAKWLNEGKRPHAYFGKLWGKVKDYLNSSEIYATDEIYEALNLMKTDKVRMTHDVYAKAYGCLLEGVDILGIGSVGMEEYDAVILDEAQDANPQILQIFKALDAKVKVAVGDTHQQIYAFRKAINAIEILRKETGEEPLYLTKSFRFEKESEMEKKANEILSSWKHESNRLVGAGKPNDDLPDAIISRTNSAIVSYLLRMPDNEKKEMAVFGNIEDIIASVGVIADAIVGRKRENGGSVYEKDYATIKKVVRKATVDDYEAILSMIRNLFIKGDVNVTGDPTDYAVACTILRKNAGLIRAGGIPSEKIEEKLKGIRFNDTTETTERIILTAHASKGLEFRDVRLIGFKATFFITMLKVYEEFLKEKVEKAARIAVEKDYETNDWDLEEIMEDRCFIITGRIVDKTPKFKDIWEKKILAEPDKFAELINEANLSYVSVTRATKSIITDGTPFFNGGAAEYEWEEFLRYKIRPIVEQAYELLLRKKGIRE